MRYFKTLIGENCYLASINPDDAEKYTEWINDLEVIINFNFNGRIVFVEQEREILEKLSEDNYNFAIID